MTFAQLAALIPWATVEQIGEEAVKAIIAYFAAGKEAQAQIKAQASTDMQALYDRVDNHLLDNNAVVDAMVEQKFPTHSMPTAEDAAKADEAVRAQTAAQMSVDPVKA